MWYFWGHFVSTIKDKDCIKKIKDHKDETVKDSTHKKKKIRVTIISFAEKWYM